MAVDPTVLAQIQEEGLRFAKLIRQNSEKLPAPLSVGLARTIEIYLEDNSPSHDTTASLAERLDAIERKAIELGLKPLQKKRHPLKLIK